MCEQNWFEMHDQSIGDDAVRHALAALLEKASKADEATVIEDISAMLIRMTRAEIEDRLDKLFIDRSGQK